MFLFSWASSSIQTELLWLCTPRMNSDEPLQLLLEVTLCMYYDPAFWLSNLVGKLPLQQQQNQLQVNKLCHMLYNKF